MFLLNTKGESSLRLWRKQNHSRKARCNIRHPGVGHGSLAGLDTGLSPPSRTMLRMVIPGGRGLGRKFALFL